MEINNTTKINKKLVIFLISLLALSLLVILFINFIPPQKNISPLNKIFTEISDCNSSLNGLINSDGIDTEKAITSLSEENDKLQSIKDSLMDIQVSNDEYKIKDELLENINYNTTLNNICLSFLENPKATNLTSKYNDYSNTYNLLLNNYDSLTAYGVNLNFEDNAKAFFNYNFKYLSTLLSLSRDNDIKVSQKNTYVTNLSNCIDSFDKIDEDLEPALNKIREDNRDFDNLIKDIKEKKSSLNEIKNQSYCINIPENGTESYNLLQDTINYYELYITSLEHSIEIERTSNSEENKKSIEENYENSFSKYSDFQDSLKNLRTELDKFNS